MLFTYDLERFRSQLKERGFAPRTVSIYSDFVEKTFPQNVEFGSDFQLWKIITDKVSEVVSQKDRSRWRASAIAWCSAEMFFAQSVGDAERENMAYRLDFLLRQNRKLFAEIPSPPVVAPSFDFCKNLVEFCISRKHVATIPIALATYMGLRISEIVQVLHRLAEGEDLGDFLQITGKGAVSRTVPVPPIIKVVLSQCDELFYLSAKNLRAFFAQAQEEFFESSEYEITDEIRIYKPHAFRHAYACRLAKMAKPEHIIQMWLGHSSPRTTAIYLQSYHADDLQEM